MFERGLSQAVGFVLPLEKGMPRWLSEHWTTRSGHLFLLPGDSAIGFRLPLNSLPYVPPQARSFVPPPDPFAPLPPLEPRDESGQGYTNGHGANGVGRMPSAAPGPFRAVNPDVTSLASEPVVRTALTVEPRDGTAVRVHAAHPHRRRLFRPAVGGGRHRPKSWAWRSISKAIRRPSIRASM